MTRTNMQKGQSAIEYLSTYGWALLAIVIVGAVLMQMGVFSQCSVTTPRASGQSVAIEGWGYTGTNNISITFTAINEDANISSITLDYDGTASDATRTIAGGLDVPAGTQATTFVDSGDGLSLTSGECASASVSLTADIGGISGQQVSFSGSMTGPVP